MNSLKDKIAFVTGAATGIGRATAIALAKAGAKVSLADINKSAAMRTVELIKEENGKAQFYQLDVSHKGAIEEVISQIIKTERGLDLAVNNAGIGGQPAAIHEIDEKNWNKVMEVNLKGLLFCMQSEIKAMLQSGGGSIVNISSLAGLNGMPKGGVYSASKHAVIGLTKTAAVEYASYNIRVNAVCPGFIQTPILDDVPQKILDYSTNIRVPMKRIGQPEEVAKSIIWLLGDESSYINGHSLAVDGGFQAG